MLKVTNDEGRVFNVRVVEEGGEYGRGGVLIHDDHRPMIEFYDATFEDDPRFADDWDGLGQFVSRYYLETLADGIGEGRLEHGLALDGGHPVWTVSAKNVREAVAYGAVVTGDNVAKALGDLVLRSVQS